MVDFENSPRGDSIFTPHPSVSSPLLTPLANPIDSGITPSYLDEDMMSTIRLKAALYHSA